ncbi:HD family phosphohydrolase [Candidatus Endomicrobiellum agilis]|uniref:HD family phosphohydrolase n=1 Tax=Candidatus Endomicrobiellum agilis TaxID=3238957 RepID=UPI003575A533|nr:HDIG domain-containing protein [Endomicrobium sp.]
MNNPFEKLKFWITFVLIKFVRKLRTERPKSPVVREPKNLLSKEIKIPTFISLIFTVTAIYCMFVTGLAVNYKTMLGAVILIAASAAFFILYARSKEKMMLKDNDAVVLMCLLFIIAVLMFQISREYISAFVSPASAFALMSAMLLSPRFGILYAVSLSSFVAFLNFMRFDIFIVMLCGSVVAVAGAQSIRSRADFINTGIKTAAVHAIIIIMFYFFGSYNVTEFKHNLFYGALNGAFVIIIILVFMPLFEKLFSRTTNIKLLELSDFNNPLLKRLILEAPGTYHHSVMAADIAEQAANVINDNSLLARVGAYYHDIGKLKNPQYFIENQVSDNNPHDGLSPTMSNLILVSHVKDGVTLAKQYNVDSEIINIIGQHHGTTSIHTFYHRALEESPNIDIENFRYPGPKPATKVAAIVMIADSSEAACRCIEEPTATRIKDTVEKIINNKFIDGQFSDCPITLKDLEAIRSSIISTIIGIYHIRIEYKE